MPDLCISCGTCVRICPQGHSRRKASSRPCSACWIAASAWWPLLPPRSTAHSRWTTHEGGRRAEELGFAKVCETAVGAALVSDEMVRIAKQDEMDNIITTCCPAVNDLIEKHYPELVKFLAPVVSPMVAHGRYIKHKDPEAKVVFVGPCLAKIDEARDVREDDAIDAVITFADMEEWMNKERACAHRAGTRRAGQRDAGLSACIPNAGVLHNVKARGLTGWQMQHIEGSDACFEMIKALKQGEMHHIFIEMNMCVGSCMGGPARMKERPSRFSAGMKVRDYGREADEEVATIDNEGIKLHKTFVDRSKPAKMPTERGDQGDSALHRQGVQERRAQLRLLRLSLLPRQGHCGLSGQGGAFHVPAAHVPDRPVHLQRGAGQLA